MQESRLFKIIYYLIDKGKVTAPELADKFEVSVRTIYRDIDVISSAGVPIYVTTGRNGGIQIAKHYIMDKLLLSDKEKETIITALRSGTIIENTDIISKLSAMFHTESENWLEVDVSRRGNTSSENSLFQLVKNAILTHRMVRIVYANTKGEIGERTICPLKLVYQFKNWYIKAYCMQKHDFRLFKLTRILQANTDEKSFNPLEFSPKEEKTPKFDAPLITLAFPKAMAYRIYDEFEKHEISQDKNGSFIVSVRMPIDEWLIGYLLSFGSHVQILEPKYLKKLVYKEAEKICKIHKP